jgi:hypothetical protein
METVTLSHNIVMAAVTSLVSIAATLVVQWLLNRRRLITWSATHTRLGISADDAVFGSVRVTINGNPVQNLFSSTVELVNQSTKDFDNLPIRLYTCDVSLQSERSELVGTTQIIPHSTTYIEEIAVKPGEKPSEAQLKIWSSRRDYLVPVLNRGQTARFTYLCTADNGLPPEIYVEIQRQGVIAKFRSPTPQYMDVPHKKAALIGSLIGITALVAVSTISLSGATIGLVALVYGLLAVVPGAVIYRILRRLKRWLIG